MSPKSPLHVVILGTPTPKQVGKSIDLPDQNEIFTVGQQPNLFELFGCHCCNASKIVGIGQLPSPLVHPRGHQKWMLDIYKEGGNLTKSLQLVSTQFIRNGNCSVHNVTFEQRYVFVSFCGSRSTSWNMRQAQGKSLCASLKKIIRCGSCSIRILKMFGFCLRV